MRGELIPVLAAGALQCIIALATVTQYGAAIQVQVLQPMMQQQSAAAESTALMAIQKQQQQQSGQQQQSLMKATVADAVAAAATAGVQVPAKQTSAKSNHRLVNKIKDARHRRRHRHHRHRYHHRLGDRATPLLAVSDPLQSQQQQAAAGSTSSSALTALESIVEEVARAGQLPATQPMPSQQQPQQQTQQPQQQVSQASTASDLLLDGSSSPITHLQQAPSNQQPQTLVSHQSPIPTMITRVPPHNSRGFFLTSMLSKIMNVLNVTEFALEMRDGISSRASCMACNAVVGLFLSPLYSKEVFSAAIRTVCTSFKIQTARVCHGLAESFQDDFEYIRKNTKLTRDEVCAVVFGVDCARRQTYNLFWTVPIPDFPTNNRPPTTTGSFGSSAEQNNNNSNGLSILSGEGGLTNMDDAPDLFEYRKSNTMMMSGSSPMPNSPTVAVSNNGGALATDKQSTSSLTSTSSATTASTARPLQSDGVTGSASDLVASKSGQPNIAEQPSNLVAKSAKMLKRPEYIFDDDRLLDNDPAASTERQLNKISSFVHITDIHIDPYYEAGSLNDCNEPLCCRATSGPVAAGDNRRQAGRWGDYGNCDTPVRTLRSALNRIREQHANAEYWLWTGDISPHDIWNISKSEATNHVRLVSKMVRDYSNGLPVFPVIGNHEAHPVNSFSPPEIKGKFSMSWLYDLLADEWSEWLPKDAIKTLRVGGYYKLQVRRGFRIIALNTNYCARLNPWSFYDPVDPANQLKWLVDELVEAELNQDKVHIIGHVPPDNRECTQAWLFNFINIVDRFKDTIIAQFYGHTHRDEWRLMYSLKRTDEPIGIQYIGPSITPFTENNPAYRVYHQDKSGHLVDSETYFFNLTEANELPTNEPNWKFSYRARTHLNMTQGLTANEWHNYLQKLHDDDVLFDSFFKNYYRSSDVKTGQVCKAKCKYQMLSDLRLSHPYKTKPKPFLANRKTSNHHHHRDRHDRHDRHDHHHHHHKRLRHSQE